MKAKRTKLPLLLCPQLYVGSEMMVTVCDRCSNWNRTEQICDVHMGVEHLPIVSPAEVPECPLASRCQHQAQTNPTPCKVRARGLVCESAVGEPGPNTFHAMEFE